MRLSLGLLLILLPFLVIGEELNYKFSWLSIPVANVSIYYENSLTLDKKVEFRLATQGPLKIYRKYSSKGYIERIGDRGWDYYLVGQDRGQSEEKFISYFFDSEPVINKFLDDKGESAIIIDSSLDKSAIDPFSVLLRTIQKLSSEHDCNNSFHIMDGKRRYKSKFNFIGKEQASLKINQKKIIDSYHCRLIILSDSKKNNSDAKKNIWPFNGGNKVIDIWFSGESEYVPIKFIIKTPIGRIVGNLTV